MNKKTLIALIAVAVVAVAVLAYFIFGGKKSDDYCSVIPEDAVLVARIAPVEFLEKNDIELDELADKMGENKRFVKMGMSYLEGSGVDITRPFYFFMDSHGSVGLCFAVSDVKDFKSMLTNEQRANIKEKDGYYLVSEAGSPACICFDKKKGLIYGNPFGPMLESDVIELMGQDASKSVLSTNLYKQLIACDKSFAVNTDYSSLLDIAKGMNLDADLNASLSAVSMFVPDCNVLSSFDIEGSKILLSADMFPNSDKAEQDLKELLGNIPVIKGDMADKGLSNPIAWLCFNFPGPRILQFVQQIPGAGEVLAQITQQVDITTLLNSFDGDVSLAVNNTFASSPEFLMMANTVNNKYVNVLSSLVNLKGSNLAIVSDGGSNFHITEKTYDFSQVWNGSLASNDDFDDDDDYFDELDELTDDDYGFDEEDIVPDLTANTNTIAYLSNTDNVFVATNNEALKSFAGKSSEAMSRFKSDMKGCYFYSVIDVAELAKLLDSNMNSITASLVRPILSQIDHVVAKAKGTHGEVTVQFSNDTKALDAIIKMGQSLFDFSK